jgi:hypothetical protein
MIGAILGIIAIVVLIGGLIWYVRLGRRGS